VMRGMRGRRGKGGIYSMTFAPSQARTICAS
jgi:hypothetical protein